MFSGIIFITIAEWFCRVKVYHRYGQNHQRTLERLSGIERRLNSRPGSMPELGDEPPPYHNSPYVQRNIPLAAITTDISIEVTDSGGPTEQSQVEIRPPSVEIRPPQTEVRIDDAPSYSVTVSDDVLPSYNEATSSEYGAATTTNTDEGDKTS